MRIAYISDTNPFDIDNWSGVAETVGDAIENNAGSEIGVWAGGIA